MQTPAQVCDSLLRNKPAERIALHEGIWADTLRKWVGQGMPADDEGNATDPAEHFGLDMVGAGGWFDLLPIRGFSEIIEETDEWKVVRNGAGAALKWWKNKSGTPEHVDFTMTSREVWDEKYRPHLLELDRERINIDAAKEGLAKRRAQGKWAHFGHMFIWENMRRSLGDLCMYESLLLDPEWIHDYNRVNTDFFIMHFRVILAEAGLPDGIWIYEDLGYCNGLFCSPKVYEDLIFPYYKEIVGFFHGYDLPVVLHACGGVEEALPLVVSAGFDALHPMERKAGCDPVRFAELTDNKLVLIGGLDVRVLETHDRDVIRTEVTKLINDMKANGVRYVFASDHSISTNVDYDDYRFALDVYRENMMY